MSTATTPTTAALEVPGATLHYEIRGTGPVLLMICGGIYDAALLADLAGRLADDHTVITYDRRGNSRSPLTEQPGPQCVPVHADDAHRLLLAVAPGQAAAVFGNSSGAQIGLELAARHPEQVRTLVAHEPPVWDVLPDGAQWRALTTEAAAIYRASGVGPAMARFGAAMGMAGDHQDGGNNTNDNADGNVQGASGDGETADTAGPPEVLEMMSRMAANTEFFLGYEVESFGEHPTDVSALSAAGTRILLAAGEESAGQPPHRAALALADRLGSTPVIVPGGHGGFASHAEGFAVALDTVLSRN
jgi:pimeloyl-ACP methyl ester carboxylesterase